MLFAPAKFHSEQVGHMISVEGLPKLAAPSTARQDCPVRQSLLCFSQFPSVLFHLSVPHSCLQQKRPLPNCAFDMKVRDGMGWWLVQVWMSPAAHRVPQFGACLKVGGERNTCQVGGCQREIAIWKITGEAKRDKSLQFLLVLIFSTKPLSIIPGLCFPFCHFSIILSISVGLLSLGCFLFSCSPIFHYLPFFLFEYFYNRVRRMWKCYNVTHKLQCHNCSSFVSPPGMQRSRSEGRGRNG